MYRKRTVLNDKRMKKSWPNITSIFALVRPFNSRHSHGSSIAPTTISREIRNDGFDHQIYRLGPSKHANAKNARTLFIVRTGTFRIT